MKASTNVISPPRRVKAQTGLLMTICSMRLFDMHGVFLWSLWRKCCMDPYSYMFSIEYKVKIRELYRNDR